MDWKFGALLVPPTPLRRTPIGVGGLKSKYIIKADYVSRSHPNRGAWIEIKEEISTVTTGYSRTPIGVRGLKWRYDQDPAHGVFRRTPIGVRGLKSIAGYGC